MKYKILESSHINEYDILTEDGGLVSVYDTGKNLISNYYQKRIKIDAVGPIENFFEELNEGKMYLMRWPENITKKEIIQDALDWLVMPRPENWELDETIFSNLTYF